MSEITAEKLVVRHYQAGEENKMAALVNLCRASERDGIVTIDMIRDEWRDSRLNLDRDTWVAVNEQGDYIAVAEVWFNDPDDDEAVVTRHVGFAMHPTYRESHTDLMEQMLDEALRHAITRPFSQPHQQYVLRAWASAFDTWKHEMALAHGFRHAHIGYTMIHDRLATLPAVTPVRGIRIERWTPARDRDLWHTLNEAFSTDESFMPLGWDDWQELYHFGRTEPRLWCLAIDEATDDVVGLALTEIDRESNHDLERRDGWVVDLAVLESYRGRGLGRSLLLTAMHGLRDAGMTAVKIGIDSHEPERATRLYDSLGFVILQGSHTYLRPLEQ